MPEPRAPKPFDEKLTLAALAFLAIGLRFVQLGQESFWSDEVFTLKAIKTGVLNFVLKSDCSPPLAYWVSALWAGCFGFSHVALRSLPAILGGLAAAGLYGAARRWGLSRAAASAAALWLALHPILYMQSQQNRYYALLLLAGVLWLATLPGLFDPAPPRRIHWPFVLAGFLNFSIHYNFIFYFAASSGFACFFCLAQRKQKARWMTMLCSHGALGAALALYLPLIFIQYHRSPMEFLPVPHLRDFLGVFRLYFFGNLLALPAWLLGIALGVAGAALLGAGYLYKGGMGGSRMIQITGETPVPQKAPVPQKTLYFLYLLGLAVGANLIAFVFSIVHRPIFFPQRYSMEYLPAFILAIPLGLDCWGRRASRILVAGAALLILGWGGLNLKTIWGEHQGFDWRGAGRIVEQQWRPGDAMLFFPDWLSGSYEVNGGCIRNRLPDSENMKPREVRRVWLFAWKQDPAWERSAVNKIFLAHAKNPPLKRTHVITMNLIPLE